LANEQLPDPKNQLNVCADPKRDTLIKYDDDIDADWSVDHCQYLDLPIIQTASVKANIDSLTELLSDTSLQPFILVGPEGCGKRLQTS